MQAGGIAHPASEVGLNRNAFREFGVLVPEGHRENSPAFQRWVEAGRQASPGGTTENWVSISGFLPSLRDSGGRQPRDPAFQRWAIVECPSGTDSYPISRKALG